jgi:hypothetical protein
MTPDPHPVPAAPAPPRAPSPLIHPLAAAVLIVVDSVWGLGDWNALLWLVTIPLSFLAATVPIFLIQRFIRGDGTGRAAAVATALGILAAVPTPVTGTVAGTVALAYAGFSLLRSRSPRVS